MNTICSPVSGHPPKCLRSFWTIPVILGPQGSRLICMHACMYIYMYACMCMEIGKRRGADKANFLSFLFSQLEQTLRTHVPPELDHSVLQRRKWTQPSGGIGDIMSQ